MYNQPERSPVKFQKITEFRTYHKLFSSKIWEIIKERPKYAAALHVQLSYPISNVFSVETTFGKLVLCWFLGVFLAYPAYL